MDIGMQTAAQQGPTGLWLDIDGFAGPFKPGNGPRSDPLGDFPTGPAVGAALPDIVVKRNDGSALDVHEHRAGKPAIVVFFRSAVW